MATVKTVHSEDTEQMPLKELDEMSYGMETV